MRCPACGSRAKVTNSREKNQRTSRYIWRRRRCTKCNLSFTTHETCPTLLKAHALHNILSKS
jgi:transcriptional regulator NrdR family protein